MQDKFSRNIGRLFGDSEIFDGSQASSSNTLTSSAEVSHARTYPWLAEVPGSTASGLVFGPNIGESLAWYDPDSCLWKTSQRSIIGDWIEFSGTFGRSGIMQNGIVSQRRPLAPLTAVTGSLSSRPVPTPTASDSRSSRNSTANPDRGGRGELLHQVKSGRPRRALPTPSATDWKGSAQPGQRRGQLSEVVAGGQLNPAWVEWLMGFPIGWTDLESSETL